MYSRKVLAKDVRSWGEKVEGIFSLQDRNKLEHIRASGGGRHGRRLCDSGGRGRREVIVQEMRFWVAGRDRKLPCCPETTLRLLFLSCSFMLSCSFCCLFLAYRLSWLWSFPPRLYSVVQSRHTLFHLISSCAYFLFLHFAFMCNRLIWLAELLIPLRGLLLLLAWAGVNLSMTAPSIFSKALWWLHILSLCLQPRLFWWQRLSRHRRKNSCSRAPWGKRGSYFNFHFVTEYQGRDTVTKHWVIWADRFNCKSQYVLSVSKCTSSHKNWINNSRQWSKAFLTPISRRRRHQAAIMNQMIAAHGVGLHRSSKHDTASQLFVAS